MILGMGIDIQEIQKMEKALARQGEALLARVFTPQEIAYCQGRQPAGQHFAGRFCAKEAFFKALGTGWGQGVAWKDVEVIHHTSGGPALQLSGRAAELAALAGVKTTWVSLTHSEAYAAASVILEG